MSEGQRYRCQYQSDTYRCHWQRGIERGTGVSGRGTGVSGREVLVADRYRCQLQKEVQVSMAEAQVSVADRYWCQ